ncbi:MAG: hypothetical protein Q7S21_05445 [archaeon]|nr:hypothetical protein [archaeon]
MATKFVTVSSKLPEETAEKFKKMAKRFNETPSGLMKLIVNAYLNEKENPLYVCEVCHAQIGENDSYYSELANLEKVCKDDKGNYEIEVMNSIPTKIICMECAFRTKKTKQFKQIISHPSHKTRFNTKVKKSDRK